MPRVKGFFSDAVLSSGGAGLRATPGMGMGEVFVWRMLIRPITFIGNFEYVKRLLGAEHDLVEGECKHLTRCTAGATGT